MVGRSGKKRDLVREIVASVRDAALNEYVEKLEKESPSKSLGEAIRTYIQDTAREYGVELEGKEAVACRLDSHELHARIRRDQLRAT